MGFLPGTTFIIDISSSESTLFFPSVVDSSTDGVSSVRDGVKMDFGSSTAGAMVGSSTDGVMWEFSSST